MDTGHEQLTHHAATLGYSTSTIAAVAEATLPRHTPGESLDEGQARSVADALEVLAQAGIRSATIRALIAAVRERCGERWREPLWRVTLRCAAQRYDDAPRYGISPLEDDEVRIARWGPAPLWATRSQDTIDEPTLAA